MSNGFTDRSSQHMATSCGFSCLILKCWNAEWSGFLGQAYLPRLFSGKELGDKCAKWSSCSGSCSAGFPYFRKSVSHTDLQGNVNSQLLRQLGNTRGLCFWTQKGHRHHTLLFQIFDASKQAGKPARVFSASLSATTVPAGLPQQDVKKEEVKTKR